MFPAHPFLHPLEKPSEHAFLPVFFTPHPDPGHLQLQPEAACILP